jgi:large subunit ribosomal protein L28
MSGNNVSHANNKTRRVFALNIHRVTLHSTLLNRTISLRMSVRGLRTIDKHGGLDGYLKSMPLCRLPKCFLPLAKELIRKSS